MTELPESVTAEAVTHGTPLHQSVVLVGFDGAHAEALARSTDGLELRWTSESSEALGILRQELIAVLCMGPAIPGAEAAWLLNELTSAQPPSFTVNMVLAAGPEPEIFADFVADDTIYYLSRELPGDDELMALISGATERFRSQFSVADEEPNRRIGKDAVSAYAHAELLRLLAVQEDPGDLAELLAKAAAKAVGADRSRCWLYEKNTELLWCKRPDGTGLFQESAAVGLTSFVLRSGLPVRLDHLVRDPRFDAEVDDPLGHGDGRLLALPVAGANQEVAAVLLVVRDADRPEFTAAEQEMLERLILQAVPYFETHCLEAELRDAAAEMVGSVQKRLFRDEALDYHLNDSDRRRGDPLRISPTWAQRCYWALLLGCLGVLLFAWFNEVYEFASGTAVVRVGGQVALTALHAGTVASIEVEIGETVQPGQVLVRFRKEQEAARLHRIEQEFEMQLIRRMRDPSNAAAEQALISLRAERDLAMAGLEDRTLRAPGAGYVSDLRVIEGQYMTPGQVVLVLAREREEPSIIVMLPGEHRPLVRPGMPIRLELEGYRYAYQHLEVEAVRDQVVSPSEALRYLGPGGNEALSLSGPVVILEARLGASTFQSQGRSYRYHEGMHGIAEVRIRSEKILFAMLPPLKTLWQDQDG